MSATPPTPLHEEENRAGRVARVRRQIADGTYESRDKLELALTRLFAAAGVSGEVDTTGLRFEASDS